MRTVDASEAKTHLSELLARVSKGESICIAVGGLPVANLVPCEEGKAKDLRKVVKEIRAIRKGSRLATLSIHDLIHEGRRY